MFHRYRASLVADSKESACNMRDPGLIPGSGRTPGEGNGNLLQYSCLEKSMERGLAGYSPWDHKELDTTDRLTHTCLSSRPATLSFLPFLKKPIIICLIDFLHGIPFTWNAFPLTLTLLILLIFYILTQMSSLDKPSLSPKSELHFSCYFFLL